jgi:hypothetical protein
MSAEAAVSLQAILIFVPVAGDVDIFRAELHEWSYTFQKFRLSESSLRRYDLQ